jgi:hypothetical protein
MRLRYLNKIDLEEEEINSGGQVDKTDTKQGFAERRSK